jgi:hypothetical protein
MSFPVKRKISKNLNKEKTLFRKKQFKQTVNVTFEAR